MNLKVYVTTVGNYSLVECSRCGPTSVTLASASEAAIAHLTSVHGVTHVSEPRVLQ